MKRKYDIGCNHGMGKLEDKGNCLTTTLDTKENGELEFKHSHAWRGEEVEKLNTWGKVCEGEERGQAHLFEFSAANEPAKPNEYKNNWIKLLDNPQEFIIISGHHNNLRGSLIKLNNYKIVRTRWKIRNETSV